MSRKDQVDDEDESARKEEVISDVLTSYGAIAFLSLLIALFCYSPSTSVFNKHSCSIRIVCFEIHLLHDEMGNQVCRCC